MGRFSFVIRHSLFVIALAVASATAWADSATIVNYRAFDGTLWVIYNTSPPFTAPAGHVLLDVDRDAVGTPPVDPDPVDLPVFKWGDYRQIEIDVIVTGLPTIDIMVPRAELDLIGPDMDPFTAGRQSYRWRIGNGVVRAQNRDDGNNWNTLTIVWGDPDLPAIDSWTASTPYALGYVVVPTTSNGHEYRATVAGTSDVAEPIWPTTPGGTVTDGTVTWTEAGAPQNKTFQIIYTPPSIWTPITAYAVGDIVVPTARNGHQYRVTVAGTSGALEPTWPTIAGGTVTDGTVTWTEDGGESDPRVFGNPWTPGYWTLAAVRVDVNGDGLFSGVAPDSANTLVEDMDGDGTADPEDITGVSVQASVGPPVIPNYFAVVNPLNLTVLKGLAPATLSTDRRFHFYGNPGNATTRDPSAAFSDAQSRYDLANGNQNFFRRMPDGSTNLYVDTYGDGGTGLFPPTRLGWELPVLDLLQAAHGSEAEFVREQSYNAGDGLVVENVSHAVFQKKGGATEPGVGGVRAETAPLIPVPDPPPGSGVRVPLLDYLGRPVPNGSYPPIPGANVELRAGSADLSEDGMGDILDWREPDDVDSGLQKTEGDASLDDEFNVNARRVQVAVRVPRYQPPLNGTETKRQVGANLVDYPAYYWTSYPLDDSIKTNVVDIPNIGGELDTGDRTIDYGIPVNEDLNGNGILDLGEDLNGNGVLDTANLRGDDENYSGRIYVDSDGDGKLGRANLQAYYRDRASADPAVQARAWTRLYEEAYRALSIRLLVGNDLSAKMMAGTIDLGKAGHADYGRNPFGFSPNYVLPLVNRGNLPLGVIPVDPATPAGAHYDQIGVSPLSHFFGDVEAGVTLPFIGEGGSRGSERFWPNYLPTPDASPGILWSMERSLPGDPTENARVFLDTGPPYTFPQPGELAGAQLRYYTSAPGTPLGTYSSGLAVFIDITENGVFNPGVEMAGSNLATAKVRITEAPLPPGYATSGDPFDPEDSDDNVEDRTNFLNINTAGAESGPVVSFAQPLDANGLPDFSPAVGPAFGTIQIYWSSDRESINDDRDEGDLYTATLAMDVTNLIRPRLVPDSDATPLVGNPLGLDDTPNTADDLVAPPDPARYPTLVSWQHSAPVLSNDASVLTWILSTTWSDASGLLAIRHFLGVLSLPGGLPQFLNLGDSPAHDPHVIGLPAGLDLPGTTPAPASADGLFLFYTGGAGPARKLYWARLDPAGTFRGQHELGVMVAYPLSGSQPTGTRLEGLQYAKEVFPFADRAPDGAVTGLAPDTLADPCIGLLFTGRTTWGSHEDIFYTRLDPGTLTDPNTYDPVVDTGQIPFPRINPEPFTDTNGNLRYDPGETFVDVNGNGEYDPGELLRPVTEEVGGRMPGARLARTFVSGDMDWSTAPGEEPVIALDFGEPYEDANANGLYDLGETFTDVNGNGRWDFQDGVPEFIFDATRIMEDPDNDGTPDKTLLVPWQTDPETGMIYKIGFDPTGATSVRVIEVDVTTGHVRFLGLEEPSAGAIFTDVNGNGVRDTMFVLPRETVRVFADYTPRTRRVTSGEFDHSNPVAVRIPPETIVLGDGPEPFIDQNGNGAFDSGEPFDDWNVNDTWDSDSQLLFDMPERLFVLYNRRAPDGSWPLSYETLSNSPEPYTDTNGNGQYDAGEPFVDANGNGIWDVDLTTWVKDFDLATLTPDYVDKLPTRVPLDVSLNEGRVSAAAVPYVWYTSRLRNAVGNLLSPYVVADQALLDNIGPGWVGGPSVVWLFFSSPARFQPASGAAFPYESDYDLFSCAVSPRQAPSLFPIPDTSDLGAGPLP